MRHGMHNKSLSRPTAARILMLRNLVSSLLQYESITTTLTKAKETQKQAERVIGWGKKGGKDNWDRANSYLLNPTETLRPLFTTLSERYQTRAGGYTRIHKVGNRQGDNADLAVLELVDSPHDLKYESAASSVGREFALLVKETGAGPTLWWDFTKRIEEGNESVVLQKLMEAQELKPLTRQNVGKVLAFRKSAPAKASMESADDAKSTPTASSADADSIVIPKALVSPTATFLARAHVHYLRSLASFENLVISPVPDPSRIIKQLTTRISPSDARGPPRPVQTIPRLGRVPRAGERLEGWTAGPGAEKVFLQGGPISRAKGSRSREGRRVEWTGIRRDAQNAE